MYPGSPYPVFPSCYCIVQHTIYPPQRSDPVVKYCETVTRESSRVCLAKSVNKLNKLYMVASPLPEGLSEEIERVSNNGFHFIIYTNNIFLNSSNF